MKQNVLITLICLLYTATFGAPLTLFESFTNTNPNWVSHEGTWGVNNGVLNATSPAHSGGYYFFPANVTNTAIESKVRFVNTDGWGVGICGRIAPTTGANYGLWLYANGRLTIEKYSDWFDTWEVLAQSSVSQPNTNWHTLRLDLLTNQVVGYLNGTRLVQANASPITGGGAGVTFWSSYTASSVQFDDFKVYRSYVVKPNQTLTLSWNPDSLNSFYNLWISSTPFNQFQFYTSTIATNLSWSYPKTNPPFGNSAYFKVHAIVPPNSSVGSVTLAWDNSPETDVNSYRVYYGTTSRGYSNSVSTSNTTCRINNLLVGTRYYFAVTARNVFGLESDYSDELSYVMSPVGGSTNYPQTRIKVVDF